MVMHIMVWSLRVRHVRKCIFGQKCHHNESQDKALEDSTFKGKACEGTYLGAMHDMVRHVSSMHVMVRYVMIMHIRIMM
jgi:hypothetical protein